MKYIYKYLIIVFVLIFSCLLYLTAGIPVSNYNFYIVSSDSMVPELNKGDLLVTQPPESFSIGDIVTFKSPIEDHSFITHRIIRENFEEEYFLSTKGDNNAAEDPWQITPDMVLGKIYYAWPYIGYPILFLKSSQVYLIVFAGIILLISVTEVNSLSSEVAYEWKRKNRYKVFRSIQRIVVKIDKFYGKLYRRRIENAG